MRAGNRILDVMGCDGTLQMRLPSAKFPLHYSVGSQPLIFLSGMRSGIWNRNLTTWATADTRFAPNEFYEQGLNRQIAIRERRGVAAYNNSI